MNFSTIAASRPLPLSSQEQRRPVEMSSGIPQKEEPIISPSANTSGKRRIEMDVKKLIVKKHDVQMMNNVNEFVVKFHGPKDSVYEDGVWKIRVELPDKYPFKSPSIGFLNKIFHPNIDEASGTVCLDVINQAWTALYDLSNIFEVFLPQLLQYPNAADPLNGEAARMYMHRREEYDRVVRARKTSKNDKKLSK
ncbi:CRE-UBC-8 protein [Caenorhabditis remanei]|uniref:CRE-UBC-8 protein n=1 Tax=Caenorhabditis remanei TaxID=31234 RepID=E3NLL7_CAERE|nr:CRE-UBC-8 protein [Caenorhabditis remanei]